MPQPLNNAQRRYTGRFATAMSLYVALVLAAPFAFARASAAPLRVAVAVAPALALLGVIWAVMRYLAEEQDEYLRARLSEALLMGLGLTLALCTVWGFLEGYGLLPRLPLVDVGPIFCGLWGLSQLARRLADLFGQRAR